MTTERVYLDHNATSPLRPQAREAVVAALDTLGNPSSVHDEGRRSRRIVEDARERVAALVGASPANVIFTSGATEANNWVAGAGWDTILLPRIEHDSIIAPARARGASIIEIGADTDGVTRVEEIAEALLLKPPTGQRCLVSLQMANNETGVLQPVAETAAFCSAHGVMCHTDAVQAAGRVKVDFADLGVDAMSLSSHKIGGPMGVGALVLRDGNNLSPMIVGGGQERRRRSGTENVAGIAGFGAAAEAASAEVQTIARLSALRDRLEAEISAVSPAATIIGRTAQRLPNTTCLALPGVSAETLLIKIDLAGIAISSGAACSSGKVGASHVLMALGLEHDTARGAIRISLGWNSSEADIDAFLRVWSTIAGNRQRAVA
jgi:cysteine desulfurase